MTFFSEFTLLKGHWGSKVLTWSPPTRCHFDLICFNLLQSTWKAVMLALKKRFPGLWNILCCLQAGPSLRLQAGPQVKNYGLSGSGCSCRGFFKIRSLLTLPPRWNSPLHLFTCSLRFGLKSDWMFSCYFLFLFWTCIPATYLCARAQC